MPRSYNNPAGGSQSSVGDQLRTDWIDKKSLIEAAKKEFFTPLSGTTHMPQYHGKKIRKYHYLPMLHDANINDEGIDANGTTSTRSITIIIKQPILPDSPIVKYYAEGEAANAVNALVAAKTRAEKVFKHLGVFSVNYATTKALLIADGWTIEDGLADVPNTGNLYGSSKDVGFILGKMPRIGEDAGRVNRVGMKRVTIEGTFDKFGIFDEWTEDSLLFDTDGANLDKHISREMLRGATESTEALLQTYLLNNAGVVRYAGSAMATNQLSGETGGVTLTTYEDLMRLSIDLDNNRCDKHTTVITGSSKVDTRTIPATRVMFIGSELEPMVRNMVNKFGKEALIPVEKYQSASKPLNGEIGKLYQFTIVVVPEMQHWEGAGKTVTNNDGYRETNNRYDVFPMLVVGNNSFTTISFKGAKGKGKSKRKFKIMRKDPGKEMMDRQNPFGDTGIMSITWYFGFLCERPEHIALVKTVAGW